jgi:hypothetical protein
LSLETTLHEKVRRAEKLVDCAIKKSKTCPLKFLKTNFIGSDNSFLDSVDYDKKNWMYFMR